MSDWLPDLADPTLPKYRAIADALARDIGSGRLKPGDRLPPQRVLAERLAVDLTTVTRAYGELGREGLIEGGGRKGSFVRGAAFAPSAGSAPGSDLGMNLPPTVEGGSLARRLREGFDALLARGDAAGLLQYQPSGGTPPDRAAAAAELTTRGIAASEDSVLLASGGQNALHALVGTVLGPGSRIGVARHVYPGLLAVARRHGLRLEVLPGDGGGIDPDGIAAACARGTIDALYLVPTNDNPTAATLDLARRKAIAGTAGKHGLTIIEDDAYGRLPSDPLPPLAALASEQTWHIASVSKIVTPALRVAWLRAPNARAAWRIAPVLHDTAVMPPPLNAALVTRWLGDGTLRHLIEETRVEAVARQAIVANILDGRSYHAHPEGYHLWLLLPDGTDEAELAATLRGVGLSAVASSAFRADRADRAAALRVSIGGNLSRAALARALRLLDAALDREDRQSAIV